MSIDFGSLIIDLELLAKSSNEDFSNEFWSEYENYLKKYNFLLKNLHSLGFFKEIEFIDLLPLSDQSFDSGFSKYEKAKLREISNASNALLKKVKLLLTPPVSKIQLNNKVRSNQIFLINGNGHEMKLDIVQKLKTLDLDPIILDEKTDIELKIIEKINDYCNVSFALIILSPDELVYLEKETPETAKYYPKQRVIFELGYFMGRLGKQNVVAIFRKNKNFHFPNEYTGIQLIEYKPGWYYELARILKDCNFNVNANKISWL